jgi:hypothetical protein
LPTPDEWQHELDEALFGTDEAEGSGRREDDVGEDLFDEDDLGAVLAPVDEQVASQPASSSGTQPPRAVTVDAVDTALFGSAAPSARTAPAPKPAVPPQILGEPATAPFADPDTATVVDPDEETIIAELADDADAAGPTRPRRGRRRVWVLAEYTALVVIIGATVGALIGGRSGSTRPGRKTVSDTTATTAPAVTTTPVPVTTAPAVTVPPSPPTAPRTPATSRRTAPQATEPSVEPEPPPPAPPPPEPPPSTSPPSTSPLL